MKKGGSQSGANRPAKTAKKPIDPKKRLRRRVIFSALGAVIVGAAIGTGVWAFKGHTLLQGIARIVGAHDLTQPENILLIGNNARNPSNPLDIGTKGGGQADIMMVAHIDPKKHQVVLISIPRDALFAMPMYNNPIPKLKTLFFIGAQMQPNQAAQLTVQAVEKFTGMHIDHWIVTDFQGFSDAINAVGGVRMDIPGRIYDPAHSGANLYPGWQTLNGAQALAYIRVRQNTASSYEINDLERDNAQAQLLLALKAKLLNSSNDISHLPGLISTWMKDVVTDMTPGDLLEVASVLHGSGSTMKHINLFNIGDSMQVASAPAPGLNQENYLTGAYYDIIDSTQVSKILKPYGSVGSDTGVPLPSPSTVPVDVYGSQAVVTQLQNAGFHVTWEGNGGTYPDQIMYPAGDMAWGLQVGRALATGNSLVEQGTNSSAVVVYAP